MPIVHSNIDLDSSISHHPIFAKLETQKERLSAFEIDTTLKQTSDVTYVITSDAKTFLFSSDYFNCRAYYVNADSLNIDIGISSGFSGSGFDIYILKNKFFTKPYFWTDADSGEPEPKYIIQNQVLTLDKPSYMPGDSLYGLIYFHASETHYGKKSEHYGKGYFRAKVKSSK